jgi:light-regulated signal transduction histidine kinase (bacteriophytochrome)
MGSGAVSRQLEAKPRVLIVNENVRGGDLLVQEVPYHALSFGSVADQPATKLTEWLAINNAGTFEAGQPAREELATKIEELARSNRELEQFAYVVAHDLQEPLRMVASYTYLLAERYRGRLDADADRFIDHASEGAQRMQTLIEDLLAYSQVARGNVKCREVDSKFALAEALRNLSAAIAESGVTIHTSALPVVAADRPQLTQVFQNLIGNAIKFRREQAPAIWLAAKRNSSQEWEFSIRDNGIGIGAEHIETVFAVFLRLHTPSEYPGNGIGLAICKRVVEGFGGRIWLESRLGEGTTFKFTLPAFLCQTPATSVVSPRGNGSAGDESGDAR